MSQNRKLAAGAIAIALLVIYSWIMMATSGSAASWAWLLLVGAVVIPVIVARTVDLRASGE